MHGNCRAKHWRPLKRESWSWQANRICISTKPRRCRPKTFRTRRFQPWRLYLSKASARRAHVHAQAFKIRLGQALRDLDSLFATEETPLTKSPRQLLARPPSSWLSHQRPRRCSQNPISHHKPQARHAHSASRPLWRHTASACQPLQQNPVWPSTHNQIKQEYCFANNEEQKRRSSTQATEITATFSASSNSTGLTQSNMTKA